MFRTNSHFFGRVSTNDKLNFIRISKCASQSIVNNLELKKEKYIFDIEDYKKKTYYCSIRKPFLRFLSSIPETLHRVKIYSDSNKTKEDLIIDEYIFREIEKGYKSNKNLVNCILELINDFGFFDAHHEPYRHFLYEFKQSNLMKNIIFFDIEETENFITNFSDKKPKVINSKLKSDLKIYSKIKLNLFSKNNIIFSGNYLYQYKNFGILSENTKFLLLKQLYKKVMEDSLSSNMVMFNKIYGEDVYFYNKIFKKKFTNRLK